MGIAAVMSCLQPLLSHHEFNLAPYSHWLEGKVQYNLLSVAWECNPFHMAS